MQREREGFGWRGLHHRGGERKISMAEMESGLGRLLTERLREPSGKEFVQVLPHRSW